MLTDVEKIVLLPSGPTFGGDVPEVFLREREAGTGINRIGDPYYNKGTGGIWKDPETGLTYALITTQSDRSKDTNLNLSDITLCIGQNDLTQTFRHPLKLPEETHLKYPDGVQDARITPIDKSFANVLGLDEAGFIISVAICNKQVRRRSFDKEDRAAAQGVTSKLDVLLSGFSSFCFFTPDLGDMDSYKPLGQIGPDNFIFRNAFISPTLVETHAGQCVNLFFRMLPGIQNVLIATKDFNRLLTDDSFREEFWATTLLQTDSDEPQIDRQKLASVTLMDPIFEWESFGNPNFTEGQIAGGGPPIPLTHYGEKLNLFIYNSVASFNEKRHAIGRNVGICVLNSDCTQVLSRLPYPIITPTLPMERRGLVDDIVFSAGGFIDDNYLNIGYTGADSNYMQARIPLDNLLKELYRYNAYGEEYK